MSLQEALRLMRMELGLTQSDLAQKLEKTYLTVNRWENGRGFPTRRAANDILAVARQGGVSADCIAYLNEVLLPESTRGASAAAYGFPEIDRDFLFQLADSSMNALYVIEAENYKLIYMNRKAKLLASRYREETLPFLADAKKAKRIGGRCYQLFGGRNTPCPFCTLPDIKGSDYHDAVLRIPENGRKVHIHAKAAVHRRKKVYIIWLTDVTQEEAELDALYELTNDIPAGVGIYHVYQNDRVELAFMNTGWYRMIGEERQRVLTQNALTDSCLLHPDDRKGLLPAARAAAAENRQLSLDLRMKLQNGAYHPLHLDARVIHKDAEKTTFYCRFRETEQKAEHEPEGKE